MSGLDPQGQAGQAGQGAQQFLQANNANQGNVGIPAQALGAMQGNPNLASLYRPNHPAGNFPNTPAPHPQQAGNMYYSPGPAQPDGSGGIAALMAAAHGSQNLANLYRPNHAVPQRFPR